MSEDARVTSQADEVSEQARWVDGNAIAGLFGELFGGDLTDSPRGCQSCGQINAVGAHRLFRGAGLVLRCPACGDVAARIVVRPDRCVLHLVGSWRLEVST